MAALLLLFPLLSGCSHPVQHRGFIKAEGTLLTDEGGQEYRIRGIGLGNWLLPEGYMWGFDTDRADRPRRIGETFAALVGPDRARRFWTECRDTYITEKDIEAIAAEGFNTVRVPIHWNLFLEDSPENEAPPYRFREEGFTRLDTLIDWCRRHRIRIVLDLHAAPGGQTGRNIDDSAHDHPQLFTDSRYQAMTIALWREIALRYREEPVILAYDLLNEPLPGDTARDLFPRLEPLYKKITAAIREVDTRHIITLEGADWGNNWSVFGPPFDDNLLYQFHKYWNTNNISSIQPYLDFRDRYQVPIWCGETGENSNGWYRRAVRLMETHDIGWAFWPWKKIGNGNNPRTIPPPDNWDLLVAYTRHRTGLSPAEGEAILREYLINCRLEHCVRHPEVLAALGLPPRAP